MSTDNDTKGRGSGRTNPGGVERDLLPILGHDESVGGVLVIQHGSEPEDLQTLIADVLDSGDDPEVRQKCDLIGRSREKDLKTTTGVNRGLGVSTDGGKTKSNERESAHGDAKKSTGDWIEVGTFNPQHLVLFVPIGTPDGSASILNNLGSLSEAVDGEYPQ